MDPLSIAVGGALLATGWLAGRRARRPPKLPEPPKQPEAICGCDHHLSAHDLATGKCHEKARLGQKYRDNQMTEWKWVPCNCRQYTGPRPIDTVFHPGYILPSEKD